MNIERSSLVRVLMVAAVLMAFTMPGTIVFAQDIGHDAGADHGQHDAGAGGHDVGGGSAGGGKEISTNGTDNNGDTRGDVASNQTGAGPHTGASGNEIGRAHV